MMSTAPEVTAYQFAARTGRPAREILDELGARGVAGVGVDESGPSYIVLRPKARFRYSRDLALGLGIAILLAVLISTAISPVFIALFPLAAVPAIPFLFDRRPMLAVSAVDEDGATTITVHGQASPELSAALDAYMAALPPAPPAPTTALAEQADHSDNDALKS